MQLGEHISAKDEDVIEWQKIGFRASIKALKACTC